MSALTDDLTEDHSVIIEMLARAGADGMHTKEGQEMLLTAKEVLLSHFKKEDSVLYPALIKASETDMDLRQLLGVYLKDLESVTRSAMEFLGKYSNGGAPKDFKTDLERFMATFRERAAKEENVLYKKFDAIY